MTDNLIYNMPTYGYIVGIMIIMTISLMSEPEPPTGCSSVAIRGRKSPLGQTSYVLEFISSTPNHP